MEKQGIVQEEQEKIKLIIADLESAHFDSEGLTKSAGGNISADVINWDDEFVYFKVTVDDEIVATPKFKRNEL